MKRLIYTFTFAVGVLSLQAQEVSTFFNDPLLKVDDALLLDYQGNLYGSHFMGSNVYKISPSGVGTVFASGFNTPNGLAFDSQNNLYVCDLYGNRIYKLSYSGVFLDTIAVTSPSGIIKSIDSDTMLFTQYTENKISKLAPDGTISLIASGAPMVGVVGLTYDNFDQLYVANFTDRKIFKLNDTTFTYVATVPGPPGGSLGFIAFANGVLYGTGYNDHKIYKIDPNYIDSVSVFAGTILGSIDGDVTIAQFNAPNGIISSITGDSLFISDFGTGRIRIISFEVVTGSNEVELTPKNVKINPNPTTDIIQVDYYGNYDQIEIYNCHGKQVYASHEKRIAVGHLYSGIYFVLIKNGSEIVTTTFIKN
jgi:sugar lactone lactonase YvrE